METKKHIRQRILSVREALTSGECTAKSAEIMQKILNLEAYRTADSILTYIEYLKEVRTTPLIERAWEDGKKVYCPRVKDDTMEFYKVSDFGELRVSARGIKEPVPVTGYTAAADAGRTILCIIPGVAFDRKLHRIGYGKGFYDKYLSGKEGLVTIAVCFECQIIEAVPAEEHDRIPELLVTESRIYERNGGI